MNSHDQTPLLVDVQHPIPKGILMRNKLLKRSWQTRLSVLLAALAVLSGLAVGTAPAANAASTDPLSSGCSNGATTIWSQTYLGYGRVEVRYSPSCGTNWVRISQATGRPAEAGIFSAPSGWKYTPSYQQSPESFWTPMVSAPGSTCVTFFANFVNANGQRLSTGNKQLC